VGFATLTLAIDPTTWAPEAGGTVDAGAKGAAALDHVRLERLLTGLHTTDARAGVLHRLCVVCVDDVGVDGAAVSAVADGTPRLLDASDSEAAAIGALQFELREGPCLDTMSTFHPSSQVDLNSDDAQARWPTFAPAVVRRGFAAAFAFPLIDGDVAVGTFDVYNRTAGPLDSSQTADVNILADLAALAVAQPDTGLVIDDVGIAVEPAAPWAHAPIVHNACGMLSQQLGISVDDALLRLRALAFVQNRTVTQLARAVVSGQLKIDPWMHHD
jgi:ANTAR domain